MMDLPGVQWQDHAAQKWIGLEPEEKEKFISVQDIDELFKSALRLTTQDDLDFLQSISASYSDQKDTDGAAKCREKGNSSFKARNYTEAALHYSQGVCLAPTSSEQLSLCYANRSAALCHLQLYQECLDDIDSSLKNGYPSHLQHKLQDRRASCLNYLCVSDKAGEEDGSSSSKSRKSPDRIKTPSAPAGVCPAASVISSVEKGRHLVAVERIAAGEVLLVDRPYSSVLIPGTQEVKGKGTEDTQSERFGTECRRCHWCLAETLRLTPCESCSYSRYCSPVCQREAWEEHHQWECPLGADLKVTGVMSQLALRVTLKAGLKNIQRAREPIRDEQPKSEFSSFKSDSTQPDDSYLGVFHLLHHLHHHSPSLRFLCAFTVAALYLRLSQEGPPPASWKPIRPSTPESQSPDGLTEGGSEAGWSSDLWLMGGAALRHMLQLRCNAQAVVALQHTGAAKSSVQSSREVRIATAIFPTLSLLNHACRPNTSLAFSTGTRADACGSEISAEDQRGVTVTVRAAKVISPGQEIFHCYGPHSSRMVTPDRQRRLLEQYFFLCECESCSSQQQEEEEEKEEEEEVRGQRSGAGGGPQGSALLCCKCKGFLKKSSDNKRFLCSESSCGHHLASSEVSNRLQEIRVQLEKAVDLLERDRPGEALKLLERSQSRSVLILAQTHPLQGELADATARAYATMGDWNNAASHLERSTVAVGSQYGEDSIELGQQLFKLAQLHFNGGARGAALSVIPQVRHLLGLHRGPRCPELQELKAMEDCLRG